MDKLGDIDQLIDGLICSHFNFIFGFIIRCNSFFHIATVVILASSASLGTVESLFSAATSETTTACKQLRIPPSRNFA